MIKSILITGGTGLIGHELIKYYIENTDFNIYQVLRQEINQNFFLNSNKINNIILDFNDYSFTSKLPNKIDSIVHLAQSVNYRNFPQYANDIFNINLRSTFQLLEYARNSNCRNFFYASSGSVYDNSLQGNLPLSEKSYIKPNPKDFYTASKIAVENIINPYYEFMNIVVGRIFFPYGIRQKRNTFMPSIIEKIFNFQEVTLNGDKGIVFNPTPVEFIAKCIFQLLENNNNGIYNIASPREISLFEYSNIVSKILNKKVSFNIKDETNPQDYSVNVDKLFKSLDIFYEDKLDSYIERYKNVFLKK